ncbi:hypothetical protein B0H12DRAFT_1324257 [Mycena haematopus]|nr:hypothetical protein B0H12DRAFT_1324257 [Mycena haematopus]
MSSLPQKRQRTDNAAITRSELWHRDGSIVLQATNTQFRVHWSVLALHSSIFRDMEGLPQPPDQPTVDGCPILELSDDPEDLEYLLKALYDPAFHCEKKLQVPLPVVGALIRLGRKYNFQYLFDSAVARLAAEFPSTLKDYDALHSMQTIHSESYHRLLFDVMTLASDNNILSVLPCVYCKVVLYCGTLDEVFDEFERADGTRASLSSLDLRRCAVGRERLLFKQFQPGNTLGWARKWEFGDCADSAQCRASREAILTFYLNDPVFALMALALPNDLKRSKFCAACRQHMTQSMAAGRRRIWAELPGMFNLPVGQLKNDILNCLPAIQLHNFSFSVPHPPSHTNTFLFQTLHLPIGSFSQLPASNVPPTLHHSPLINEVLNRKRAAFIFYPPCVIFGPACSWDGKTGEGYKRRGSGEENRAGNWMAGHEWEVLHTVAFPFNTDIFHASSFPLTFVRIDDDL